MFLPAIPSAQGLNLPSAVAGPKVRCGSKPAERGAPETAARYSEAVARYSQLSVTFRFVELVCHEHPSGWNYVEDEGRPLGAVL
jgi:hypothetical protein